LRKRGFLAHRSASRSEDGTEIQAGESAGRTGRERDPSRDAPAIFGGGQNPHLAWGLRGEDSIAELFRCEGIVQNLYYRWSKDFLEAGKKRLAGDTTRAATSDEVKDLRREAGALKEVLAELTLENRLLKKSMIADGSPVPLAISRTPNDGFSATNKATKTFLSFRTRCRLMELSNICSLHLNLKGVRRRFVVVGQTLQNRAA
jgi:transposase-like protein